MRRKGRLSANGAPPTPRRRRDRRRISTYRLRACVACLCVVQATEQFSPWLAAAHFSNHTTRHIELLNWGRYRRDRPRIERQTRLQHHLSQFAHMRTCAQLMQEREVATRAHYDVVLKMRDNTVAVS